MRIYIQASELVMTAEEMKQKIPKEKLEQIQGKGILQAYTLAQEGISQPKILNEKSTPLKWTKAIIHRLADKIKAGVKFFIDHGNNTNSHDGRKSVGEILSSFVKNIHGKLSNVIIGHFPNAEEVKNADVCSMEADIDTIQDVVDDINEVSGIALGNSNNVNPAFPGAIRLGLIQCFNTENNSGEGETKMGEEVKITFDMVKKAVKDMNIFPWQLYTEEDMKRDKVFGKIYTTNTALTTENEKLKTDLKDATEKGSEAIKKQEIAEAGKKLDSLMQEGYTDKQKTFIKNAFDPAGLKDLEETTLKEFLEKGKKDFAAQAKFFGADSSQSNEEIKTGDENKTADESIEEQALKVLGV